MTDQLCSRCGAPLEHSEDPKAPRTCRFCHAEQAAPDALVAAERVAAEVREELRGERDRNRRTARAFLFGALGIAAAFAALTLALRSPSPSPVAVTPAPVSPSPSATPTTLPAAAPPANTAEKTGYPCAVTLTLSEKGGGSGAFDEARRIAVDDAGFAYVADKTGRIQRFDDKGAFVASFRAETTNQAPGPLSSDIGLVLGLAVDHKDRLFVSIGYDVLIYETATFKQVGQLRHAYPSTCFRDIVADQTGVLFVRSACTDSNRYGIVKIDRNGKVLSTYPEGAAWELDTSDKMAIDAAGLLYAPHHNESQIVVLDAHGKVLSHFGGKGDALGYFQSAAPGPLVIDAKGRLFATNWDGIDIYDLTGHALGRLPILWKGIPRDIATGPDSALWIVSQESGVLRLHVGE